MKALKVQAHLHERGGIYYFRIAYPKIIMESIGKPGEFKISLRTSDLKDAQRLSCFMSQDLPLLFATVAFNAKNMKTDEIKKLVRSYFEKKLLDYSEGLIFERSVVRGNGGPGFDPSVIAGMTERSLTRLTHMKNLGVAQSYGRAQERIAAVLIKDHGAAVNDDDRSELCHGLVRAGLEAERMNLAHLSGNPAEGQIKDSYFSGCRNFFDHPDPALYFENMQLPYIQEKRLRPRIIHPLRETITRYLAHRRIVIQQLGQRLYKLDEHEGFFERLCEIWGADTDITRISKEDCRTLRGHLYRFPKRFNENFGKNGIALLAVLNGGEEYETIGLAQAKKMWDVYDSFFKWCRDEEIIASAPTEGIKVSGKKHSIDDRDSLSEEQLNALFNCALYRGRKSAKRAPWEPGEQIIKDAQFWMPLVGLFSGLRAGEILTLRLMDIRLDGQTPYFDINVDEEGKTLKTPESRRKVPVHPELIKIGLMSYWTERKKSREPQERLFTGVPVPADRPSNKYSNKFSQLLDKIGAKTSKTSFHSLRHNFGDKIRRLTDGVTEEMKDALDGRSSGGRSGNSRKNYGSRFTPTELYEVVKQVSYKNLDLTHLYSKS